MIKVNVQITCFPLFILISALLCKETVFIKGIMLLVQRDGIVFSFHQNEGHTFIILLSYLVETCTQMDYKWALTIYSVMVLWSFPHVEVQLKQFKLLSPRPSYGMQEILQHLYAILLLQLQKQNVNLIIHVDSNGWNTAICRLRIQHNRTNSSISKSERNSNSSKHKHKNYLSILGISFASRKLSSWKLKKCYKQFLVSYKFNMDFT